MLQRITDRNIWLINATILLVGIAYGIAISLLAIFLNRKGYTSSDIGSLAAWFALGIVVFSRPMGSLIRRLSARTTLIISLIGYAAAVSIFPYVTETFWLAALVRVFDGAFSVGIWVSCETIVLSRADAAHKAFVTTLYAIAISVGYMVGPFCAKLLVTQVPMAWAFVGAGVLSLLTAVLVIMRLDPDVEHEEEENSRGEPAPADSIGALTWRIKTSCFGSFAYGYFQSSVVLLLPLYLMSSKGIAEERTIMVPGFFAIGMFAFTNIAGRLGDKYGHLKLMRVLGSVGTLSVVWFIFLDDFWMMCAAIVMAGATLASISPLSLALQGVTVKPRDFRRANAVYNAFYGAGMLFGPAISSAILEAAGGAAMLYHLVGLWLIFVAFALVFRADDPAYLRHRQSPSPT